MNDTLQEFLTDDQIMQTLDSRIPDRDLDCVLDAADAGISLMVPPGIEHRIAPEPAVRDRYDDAIDYLTAHPEEIGKAWVDQYVHLAGCLFRFMSPDGSSSFPNESDAMCGCPTMIRLGGYVAGTAELTRRIRDDESLPNGCGDITIEHLPRFAFWQHHLDRTIRQPLRPVDAFALATKATLESRARVEEQGAAMDVTERDDRFAVG